jgi:hypothetical protein
MLAVYEGLRVVAVFRRAFRVTAEGRQHSIVLAGFDAGALGLRPGDVVSFLGGPGQLAAAEDLLAAGHAQPADGVVLLAAGLSRQDENGVWHELTPPFEEDDAFVPKPGTTSLAADDLASLGALVRLWLEEGSPPGAKPGRLSERVRTTITSDETGRREVLADASLWLLGRNPPYSPFDLCCADPSVTRDPEGRLVMEPSSYLVFDPDASEGSLGSAEISRIVKEPDGWRVARLFKDDEARQAWRRAVDEPRAFRGIAQDVVGSAFLVKDSGTIVVGCGNLELFGLEWGHEVEFTARPGRELIDRLRREDPTNLFVLGRDGVFLTALGMESGQPTLALAGPLRRKHATGWENLPVVHAFTPGVRAIVGDEHARLGALVGEWLRAGTPPPSSLLDGVTADETLRREVWTAAPRWLSLHRPAFDDYDVSVAQIVPPLPEGSGQIYGPLQFVVRPRESAGGPAPIRGEIAAIVHEPGGWRIARLFSAEQR